MSKALTRAGRPMRESSVQSHLIETAAALGGKAIKIEGEAGTPDTLVKVPGVPGFLVECKRPGEAPKRHQATRSAEWEGVGMSTYWVSTRREVDLLLRDGVWLRSWSEAK